MSKGGLNDKSQKSVKASQNDVHVPQQLDIPSEQSSKSMKSYNSFNNLVYSHLCKIFT
jgi:hypothetical protein